MMGHNYFPFCLSMFRNRGRGRGGGGRCNRVLLSRGLLSSLPGVNGKGRRPRCGERKSNSFLHSGRGKPESGNLLANASLGISQGSPCPFPCLDTWPHSFPPFFLIMFSGNSFLRKPASSFLVCLSPLPLLHHHSKREKALKQTTQLDISFCCCLFILGKGHKSSKPEVDEIVCYFTERALLLTGKVLYTGLEAQACFYNV